MEWQVFAASRCDKVHVAEPACLDDVTGGSQALDVVWVYGFVAASAVSQSVRCEF